MGNAERNDESDPLAFHVGDRLRKAREATGLDRQTFADEIGQSRKTVSAYENWVDLKAPRESTLRQWSMATGVSLHWLKTGEQPPGPLAQLVELRTFNPKSASHLHLVASNPMPEPSISSAAPRLLEVPASPIRLIR